MCWICDFFGFLLTWLAYRTTKILLYLTDHCFEPWKLILLIVIRILFTMAGSSESCCVPKCSSTRMDNTILHSFPNPKTNLERFLIWTQSIGDTITNLDHGFVFRNRKVCHNHFEPKYLTWSRRLSSNAVPTLLLPGFQVLRDVTNNQETNESVALETITECQVLGDVTNFQNVQTTNKSFAQEISTGTSGFHLQKRKAEKALQTCPTKRSKFVDTKNALIKSLKKLKVKNLNYGSRLKKAMVLSENKTFQNLLKKFSTMAAIFTTMQFREISKSKMGRRFNQNEKIMALSLYKRSPRAYRWLQKLFVLPSPLTLSRLIGRANIKPGINQSIFQQIQNKAKKMSDSEKLCILMFDEMSIAPNISYNRRKDEISGFVTNGKTKQKKLADHALVFMIRGIQKNYKQPVAYTFCSGSTNKNELAVLIKEVIRSVNSTGLRVLATVCDQGATNVSALNILIKETRQEYVRNNMELKQDVFEIDGNEVIPLFDPPHLIKGIRNNLLTKNLKCTMDGVVKTAKWEHIIKLHQEDPAYRGLKLVKNLTEQHVNPDKFKKMKVKFATQVLSQRVAVTMGFLAEKKILPEESTETADIILFFDELFDSLNGSRDNSEKRSGKSLLRAVTASSEHWGVWTKAKNILRTMKFENSDVSNKNRSVPTLKNWLLTIKNIEYLVKKLKSEFNVGSVWTRHLNQDPLENFFGAIRSHGCRNTNPTPVGFESSFASLLITNLSSQYALGANCEEDNCEVMLDSINSVLANTSMKDSKVTEFSNIHFEFDMVEYDVKKNDPRIQAQLEYVTGYVIKKTRQNVFKNCKKCKLSFYDKNNESKFLKLREYKKNKACLTYPHEKIVKMFSNIQDIVTQMIKKYYTISNLKEMTKTILYTNFEFTDFDFCEEHRSEVIEYIMELSCMFFLCNWSKDVNAVLKGTRLDYDLEDEVKSMAHNHFVKKKHNKKN